VEFHPDETTDSVMLSSPVPTHGHKVMSAEQLEKVFSALPKRMAQLVAPLVEPHWV